MIIEIEKKFINESLIVINETIFTMKSKNTLKFAKFIN